MVIVVLVQGLINEDLENAVLVTKQSQTGREVVVIADLLCFRVQVRLHLLKVP